MGRLVGARDRPRLFSSSLLSTARYLHPHNKFNIPLRLAVWPLYHHPIVYFHHSYYSPRTSGWSGYCASWYCSNCTCVARDSSGKRRKVRGTRQREETKKGKEFKKWTKFSFSCYDMTICLICVLCGFFFSLFVSPVLPLPPARRRRATSATPSLTHSRPFILIHLEFNLLFWKGEVNGFNFGGFHFLCFYIYAVFYRNV